MRACWLKWVDRDWSISADYIWLNYSIANTEISLMFTGVSENPNKICAACYPGAAFGSYRLLPVRIRYAPHRPLCAIARMSMASAPIPMAVIAEAMRPQATAAQQAQTKTAISDTDKAEGTTSSNTTDSSDSAVDVKRDNNAAPSARPAQPTAPSPISFLI